MSFLERGTRHALARWPLGVVGGFFVVHRRIREIGEDFDRDGRLLRLIRCQQCGLLMREYLHA